MASIFSGLSEPMLCEIICAGNLMKEIKSNTLAVSCKNFLV